VLAVALAITSWLVASTASPALAVSFLKGEYFILPNDHPDVGAQTGGIDGIRVTNTVNGIDCSGGVCLPTYSGTPYPTSGPIADLSGTKIQWWVAGTLGKTVDTGVGGGTGVVFNDPIPFVGSGFFPAGQLANGDGHDSIPGIGFRAVHWTGKFLAPLSGEAHFTLRADDDAFLFVQGPGIANPLIINDGGIKALGATPAVAGDLTGLTPNAFYDVDLFFADRFEVESAVQFTSDVELNATPEPASLLLFGTTLAGLGAVARRLRAKRERLQA